MERSYSRQEAEQLRAHSGNFSRLGWALLGEMGGMLGTQLLLLGAVRLLAPFLLRDPKFQVVLSLVSVYGVGFLLFCLIGLRVPAAPHWEQRRPLKAGTFLQVYLAGMAGLYLTNFATLALTALIGHLRGAPVENPVDVISGYPILLNLLLVCVAAPLVEELIFRGILLRRLLPYGEKFAVLTSALCFALFHGNLNQAFYAFVLGVLFACVIVHTDCLWQTILLHAMVNFAGGVLPVLLGRMGRVGGYLLGPMMLFFLMGGGGAFFNLSREVHFQPGGFALPERLKWRLFFENPGVICFCLACLLLIGSNLLA